MSLPIRVRLTVWYALLLAAIIVGLGAFLVLNLRSDLQSTVDRDVRANSVQIARGYEAEGTPEFKDVSGTVLPFGTAAAQVLDQQGHVLSSYGMPIAGPIMSSDMRAEALTGKHPIGTVELQGHDHPYRAMATAVRRRGQARVIVVAQSLEKVDESVERVLVLLLLAGPAALLATALGGWWLARKALRPVQRMTSLAKEIGIDRLHERIPRPRATDEIGYLALTLNEMLERLERGVEEKHRLVADASHELRTPLAAMRAELDISLRGDDLSAAARVVLESTLEEVERMSRTVDNLLTLARVDEGGLELLAGQVDLAQASEAAADSLQSLAHANGVRLEVDGEPCQVRADPQRLHQALINFIENAIKYTQPGGEVHVTTWAGDDEAGVTVSDNGPGIPATARLHVFDRFYRVDPARGRGGGSGLGLAICREIASAHGGRVHVESEEGKGSKFTLTLPRRGRLGPAEATPTPLRTPLTVR